MTPPMLMRYAALLCLMALGMSAVGCNVESDVAFFVIKPMGLGILWLMVKLEDRWSRQGKIKNFNAK